MCFDGGFCVECDDVVFDVEYRVCVFFHSVYVEYGDSLMLRVHLCPRGGVHVVFVLVSALFYDEFVVFVIDEFAFGVCFVGCGLER